MVSVTNSRARFDYELGEQFEAGLELSGFEVKALRLGQAKLVGARILVRGGEAFLMGAEIQPYQPQNLPPNYHTGRPIKLLLTKKEINHLAGAGESAGLTIIPLSVYNKKGHLKLGLALGRPKKKSDKRQKIKKRETEREVRRTLKRG